MLSGTWMWPRPECRILPAISLADMRQPHKQMSSHLFKKDCGGKGRKNTKIHGHRHRHRDRGTGTAFKFPMLFPAADRSRNECRTRVEAHVAHSLYRESTESRSVQSWMMRRSRRKLGISNPAYMNEYSQVTRKAIRVTLTLIASGSFGHSLLR